MLVPAYRFDQPDMRRPVSPWLALGMAAVGLSVVFGALAAARATADAGDACRVQVQDSEQRIRQAVYEANRAHGDKIAALLKRLP